MISVAGYDVGTDVFSAPCRGPHTTEGALMCRPTLCPELLAFLDDLTSGNRGLRPAAVPYLLAGTVARARGKMTYEH
jgi:hypothetical protein